ncbi:MAG: T9SS type A sorting domain-containing protein [Bacteroidetes bacterium]|nr:T9SS type A sorting domain-containing protein [Bacteroidota bacterium]
MPLLAILLMVYENNNLVTAEPAPQAPESTFVLQFDGTDDRVTVPYDASFPTEVFTASAWIKLPQPAGRAAIIARGEDDNSFNLSWQLYVTRDGTLETMLEDARENNYCYPFNNCAPLGMCTIVGDLFVADDAWHHVAVTRDDAGALALYVDGEMRASCVGTGIPSSNNFQDLSIGSTFGTIGPPPGGVEPPVWFFPGLIDEPAMWNVALTDTQITDIFSSGVDPLSSGLVGYWTFDEGTGQAVADLSSAGNDGFLGAISDPDSADPLWVDAAATGVEEGPVPADGGLFLEPNYPNPFHSTTTLRFSLAEAGYLRLRVYDAQGRWVETVAEGVYGAGTHEVIVDGALLPGGVYFYQLKTPNGQRTGRMWHVR